MRKLLLLAALVAALATPARAALPTTNSVVTYTSNGVTTAFATGYRFLDNTHLIVQKTALSGATTTLALGTDYSVTGANAAAGGTVTLSSAITSGWTLKIKRSTPRTQTCSLRSLPALASRDVENCLDRLEMQLQELNDGTSLDVTTVAAQAAGSTTPRLLANWFADVVNVKAYGASCNGSSDDTSAFTAAIAALPASGGVLDARSCTGGVVLTSLSITKTGTTILWPAANIALGNNSLSIPVGTHNVSLVGPTPWGSESDSSVRGCYFTYTGTGAAIVVGDSTGNTGGFRLSDCTVRIGGAGSAAIGIQLNRAIFYDLTRPRVQGLLTANTQKDIDLEGGVYFTGGTIDTPRIDNGNVGIYFGQNANANTVVNPYIALPTSGTGLNFAGAAAGPLNGNTVVGGDIENCTTAVNFDYASDNTVWGLRVESCTNAVTATANSSQNLVFSNGQTHLMGVSDSGINNAFTDTYFAQLSRAAWKLRNAQDSEGSLTILSGSSAGQFSSIYFNDRGTNKYSVRKNTDNTFSIVNLATNVPRIQSAASNMGINGESAGSVYFNLDTNSGTGGVQFGSGGASPTTVNKVDSTGRVIFTGVTQASLGTPANGSIQYCSDCTIANPCAGGGTGALAKRLNGVWVCN